MCQLNWTTGTGDMPSTIILGPQLHAKLTCGLVVSSRLPFSSMRASSNQLVTWTEWRLAFQESEKDSSCLTALRDTWLVGETLALPMSQAWGPFRLTLHHWLSRSQALRLSCWRPAFSLVCSLLTQLQLWECQPPQSCEANSLEGISYIHKQHPIYYFFWRTQ